MTNKIENIDSVLYNTTMKTIILLKTISNNPGIHSAEVSRQLAVIEDVDAETIKKNLQRLYSRRYICYGTKRGTIKPLQLTPAGKKVLENAEKYIKELW